MKGGRIRYKLSAGRSGKGNGGKPVRQSRLARAQPYRIKKERKKTTSSHAKKNAGAHPKTRTHTHTQTQTHAQAHQSTSTRKRSGTGRMREGEAGNQEKKGGKVKRGCYEPSRDGREAGR